MSKIDAREVQGVIARRGINVCVGIPAAFMVIALVARAKLDFLATPATSAENLRIGSYFLIGLAAMMLGGAMLWKRHILRSEQLKVAIRTYPAKFAEILADELYPVFIVAAIPAGIGLIFYFLGGDLDTYVLISVFCPAGLMLLKPRESEIEQLEGELPVSED